MTIKTYPFDPAEYLDTPETMAAYLDEAFAAAIEDRDPGLIAAALGDIAKAEGMAAIAKKAGVTREALYKALRTEGDPKLSTLLGVLNALDLQIHVDPSRRTDRGTESCAP